MIQGYEDVSQLLAARHIRSLLYFCGLVGTTHKPTDAHKDVGSVF